MSDFTSIAETILSRAERRRQERAAQKLQGRMLVSPTRLEVSQLLGPIVAAGRQHELVLGFLLERGLKVQDGRAVLDQEEFQAWLREKQAPAPAADTEAPAHA